MGINKYQELHNREFEEARKPRADFEKIANNLYNRYLDNYEFDKTFNIPEIYDIQRKKERFPKNIKKNFINARDYLLGILAAATFLMAGSIGWAILSYKENNPQEFKIPQKNIEIKIEDKHQKRELDKILHFIEQEPLK